MEAPEHLRYSRMHLWVRTDKERATIGITDYAQLEYGMITFIELPELHEHIEANSYLGSLETIHQEVDLYSPLTGKVVAVNLLLEKDSVRMNNSPYDQGWICVIELTEMAEIDGLWSAEEYVNNNT
jgi:glycine cleavage system H protein